MKHTESPPITGVLGGLGPDTTATFYLDLIEQGTREERPPVCIWSLPLNIQKEADFIARGEHREHIRRLLFEGAKLLEKAGCDQIVIPCNTVHEFHAELRDSVGVEFPSLIDIVSEEIQRRSWDKVLLLATSRTVGTGLYQNALKGTGIQLTRPEPRDQEELDQLIIGLLGNRRDEKHQTFLRELVEKAGSDKVLLGCTDLQLLIAPSETVVDSMQCLVRHVAKSVLG